MNKNASISMVLLLVLVLGLSLVMGCGLVDVTPPVIGVGDESQITTTSATITWTTDEPASSQVEYGQTTSYGSSTALDTNLVTSHSVSLSGLSAATAYHYRVKSKDASGNVAASGDLIFTTATST